MGTQGVLPYSIYMANIRAYRHSRPDELYLASHGFDPIEISYIEHYDGDLLPRDEAAVLIRYRWVWTCPDLHHPSVFPTYCQLLHSLTPYLGLAWKVPVRGLALILQESRALGTERYLWHELTETDLLVLTDLAQIAREDARVLSAIMSARSREGDNITFIEARPEDLQQPALRPIVQRLRNLATYTEDSLERVRSFLTRIGITDFSPVVPGGSND